MSLCGYPNRLLVKGSSNVLIVLLGLAVMCIPYDAIRFLPSNYRPLALVPLALAFLFGIKNISRVKLGASIAFLSLFSSYAFVVTFLDNWIFGFTADIADCFITIAIGFFVYFVSYCCFKTLADSHDLNGYLIWFCNMVSKAFVVPIIVGYLQAACMFHLLPNVVAIFLAAVFGAPQVGRIALTSSEASWASCLMLFAMPLIFISYRNSSNRRILFEFVSLVLLFLLNASAQGIATIGIGLLIFPFLLSCVRGDLLELVKKAIPIVLVVVLLIALLPLLVRFVPAPTYVKDRFMNLVSIDALIHEDGSSFIRICHPILCLLMWANSPLVGYGAGCFPFLYSGYLANFFPWATDGRFFEVTQYYMGIFEPSPLNLYARTLAEFGVFGLVLYVGFLVASIKRVKFFLGLSNSYLIAILLWVGFLLAIPVQFQSYCYVPVLFGFAFISAAPQADSSSAYTAD